MLFKASNPCKIFAIPCRAFLKIIPSDLSVPIQTPWIRPREGIQRPTIVLRHRWSACVLRSATDTYVRSFLECTRQVDIDTRYRGYRGNIAAASSSLHSLWPLSQVVMVTSPRSSLGILANSKVFFERVVSEFSCRLEARLLRNTNSS